MRARVPGGLRSSRRAQQRSRLAAPRGAVLKPALLALALTMGCRTQAPPTVTAAAYRFRCDPPEARIILDEEDRGPCVLWQDRWMGLSPGVHRLRVERDPWLPQEMELSPNGRRNTITVTLRCAPD